MHYTFKQWGNFLNNYELKILLTKILCGFHGVRNIEDIMGSVCVCGVCVCGGGGGGGGGLGWGGGPALYFIKMIKEFSV